MFGHRLTGMFAMTLVLLACTPSGGQDGSEDDDEPNPAGRGGGNESPGGASGSSAGGQGGEPSPPAGGQGGSDAMPPSGGTAAGGTGGSTQAPAFPPCPQGNVCDDFEAGQTGQMPMGWTRAGNVAVSDAKAFSGSKALLVQVPGGQNGMTFAVKRGAPLFPAAGNRYHGRMMVFFESEPSSAHITNIMSEGSVPGKGYRAQYRYGIQGGKIMANYETFDVASDCFKHSGVPLPVGRWVCYQWEFNGPENEMRFWFDGEEVPSMHIRGYGSGCVSPTYKDPWFAPTFESVSLGYRHYQASGPQKMWIDDVALGAQQTPCPTIKAP